MTKFFFDFHRSLAFYLTKQTDRAGLPSSRLNTAKSNRLKATKIRAIIKLALVRPWFDGNGGICAV